jgi:hypothetical protein
MSAFSEPEACLLRQWKEVRLLEQSLKSTRNRYATLFEGVLDEIEKKYPDLTCRDARFQKYDNCVGIGKETWRASRRDYYVSGLGR